MPDPAETDPSIPGESVGDAAPVGHQPDDVVPPMLPSRTAFLLAFAGVVVAGILGGIIGYGIADVSSQSDVSHLIGTIVGSVAAAAGAEIVAVLVLRAMAEWRRQNPQ